MKCQNKTANISRCSCTYEPCPRKGICCECIDYHISRRELPACAFSKEMEATYDRSMASFVRNFKNR